MQGIQHEPDRPGLGPLGADRKKLTEISKVAENMSRMNWSISDVGHTEKASKWLPYTGTLSERVHCTGRRNRGDKSLKKVGMSLAWWRDRKDMRVARVEETGASLAGDENGHRETPNHDYQFGFYYKTHCKTVEGFKQESDMIWFMF